MADLQIQFKMEKIRVGVIGKMGKDYSIDDIVISKESLMEVLDILLEIVLGLFVNPLLEIVEIECIEVGDLLRR